MLQLIKSTLSKDSRGNIVKNIIKSLSVAILTVLFTACGGGGGSGTPTNTAPVLGNIGNQTVTEDTPKNVTLSATDADNDTFSFTATSATHITASTSGNILTLTPDANWNGSENITVTVSDGSDTDSETIDVIVSSVNDAPTNINLSHSTILENQPSGTTIGTLSAADIDSGDSTTFTLGCGTAGTDDASFSISDTSLKSSAVFDHETQNSYAICIRVTDGSSANFDKNFIITVTDIAELDSALFGSITFGSETSLIFDTDTFN